MSPFIENLRERFRATDIVMRLIYINVGVWLFITLLNIVWTLCGGHGRLLTEYLELPSSPAHWAMQPWSLITYMFLHTDMFHLLFNMLWLYAFGRIFLNVYSPRQLRNLYLIGGLAGGLLFMVVYNVSPYFHMSPAGTCLEGASAAVLAVVVATALRMPNYSLRLLFIGDVKLKYLAALVVLIDVVSVTGLNAGGHIAHLGGALAGWFFVHRQRRPKMELHRGGRADDYDYNARQRQRGEQVDRILEKLRKSGYDSLTEEEKKSLFDASKR
jgi:membrane associated rhomboid family serine protease